jgi:hypothetical protein
MAAPTQFRLTPNAAILADANPTRFFALLTTAGLLNALIAAYLFLHLPADRHPTLTSLALRAGLYVVFGALAGTVGAWFYWRRPSSPFRNNPPIPFRLFALSSAAGWVWIPAVVLLSREDSPFTAVAALLAASVLALGLRKVIPLGSEIGRPHPWAHRAAPPMLFAATLHTPRRRAYGYAMAVAIYCAIFELRDHSFLDASALLAACAFVMVWMPTLAPAESPDRALQHRRATWRLVLVLLPAFLATLFALLSGIEHRNRVEAAAAEGDGTGNQAARHTRGDQAQAAEDAASPTGYHSIILWPVPQKNRIQPPLPPPSPLLAPGTTKPLIIHFTGPYWYFQPPDKRPGAAAIQAKGTPLEHDIASNNFIPLTMEAHQTLGQSIPLARCREIQVGILNSDNEPGAVNLAVLLSDSASPANQLYLGQQPVPITQPANFSEKSRPLAETLHFAIPETVKIRRFDEITVMFLPEAAHYDRGPKIAVEEFQLVPR